MTIQMVSDAYHVYIIQTFINHDILKDSYPTPTIKVAIKYLIYILSNKNGSIQ